MNTTIKEFCNFFVTILLVILVIYISFFTTIPIKIGNVIRLLIEETTNQHEEYSSEFDVNELGISMNTYYYDTLTDSQKKIYSAIANSVKDFEKEFAVRGYTPKDRDDFANEVSIAIEAFSNDHPEVFYLKSQYSTYILSGFAGNIGYIKLNYTEDKFDKVNEKIQSMKTKIYKYTTGTENLTEFEKELNIHDKFANIVKYSYLDELPRKYHTVEGPLLENTGVCDGFTKSLQLIYDAVGIDSIIVLGSLEGRPHAWNLVEIEDNWYNLDVTSSRSIYDETGIVNHAYFNLTNEKMSKLAIFDNEELLPVTASSEYDFYEYNDLMIDASQNIKEQLQKVYKSFENKEYMEFYLEGNVADNITNILVDLRQIDSSFLSGTKMYYYNIKNAIIIPRNELN